MEFVERGPCEEGATQDCARTLQRETSESLTEKLHESKQKTATRNLSNCRAHVGSRDLLLARGERFC